jgi:hypothetical protein
MSCTRIWAAAIVLTVCAAGALAQNAGAPQSAPGAAPQATPAATPQAAPVASQPATAPADRQPIKARVLEVKGDVKHAPLDSEDWQPCKVDDEYPEQTVILTGIRSSLKLQVGTDDTYTAVVIEPASKTLLSEAYTTADAKHVNIGVGYGRIRAGVVEGGLKSNFTVESPVATLSKRGTWNFGLFYERGTDRFEIFLLDFGLVDAFSRVTAEQRRLRPGEWVTQAMLRWAEQSQFLRNVAIADFLGQADAFVAFNRLQQDGLRVLNPEGGQTVLINLSNAQAQNTFLDLVRNTLPPPILPAGTKTRPEAYFGTGRGEQLIPVIINATSPLAQKGYAQPGTYTFTRSALESWIKQSGGR